MSTPEELPNASPRRRVTGGLFAIKRRRPGFARVAVGTILAVALNLSSSLGQADYGVLRGLVTDQDFDAPLPRVRVTLVEALQTVFTADDGAYVFERVPPGRYTVTFAKDGFERESRLDVVVTPGRVAQIDVSLAAEIIELEEMVVTGVDLLGDTEIGLLELRAESLAVQDAISSELLSKAGVSDVAGALKLVTGTSVARGKYATVRGLSDRYTGTTINGVRIPSADPRRRAVQVDLFPTGTVDSVTVTKTFLPNLLGDFTGGGVDIATRSIPDGAELAFSISAEHNDLATDNERFLTYEGGGIDTFGFGASDRGLKLQAPSELPSETTRPSDEDIRLAAEWDAFANSLAPVLGVSRESADLNRGYSLTLGDRFEVLGGRTLGLIGSLTYSNKFDFYENGRNDRGEISTGGAAIATQRRVDSVGVEELLMGGLLSAQLDIDDANHVALRLITNHAVEDSARLEITPTGNTEQQNQALRYVERTVGSYQIHGEHDFESLGDLELSWVTAYNSTNQAEPDSRFFRNIFNPDTLSFAFPGDGSSLGEKTRRLFRDIEESGWLGKLDLSYSLLFRFGREGSISAGLYYDDTERSLTQDSFTYTAMRALCSRRFSWCREFNASRSNNMAESADALWTDTFTDPGQVGFPLDPDPRLPANQLNWYPIPLFSDVRYEGGQTISAGYGMLELPLWDSWTLTSGARFESTKMTILPSADTDDSECPPAELDPDCARPGRIEVVVVQVTENPITGDISVNRGLATPFVAEGAGDGEIDDSHLLPAIAVTYEPRSDMRLRLSWTKTIARPTFRELSPVATIEFLQGDEFIGNPELEISSITNYDARWEWLPQGSGDLIAVSVFYKDIRDPIEYVGFGVSSRSFVFPENFEKGEVQGFEVEGRTSLGRFGDRQWLRDLSVGFNFTRLDSSVELPELELAELGDFAEGVTERPLQGQPEYIGNLFVSYDNDRTGTSASVFYNATGETLLTGFGRTFDNLRPDVFETETFDLSAKFTQRINEWLSVSVKGSNHTAEPEETVWRSPDGSDEAIRTLWDTGRRIGVSMAFNW
jgi:TonB-dependent receptor